VNNSSQEQTFTITLDDVNKELVALNGTTDITISSWSAANIPALTTSDIITLTDTPYNTYGSGSVTVGNIETIDLSEIESFEVFTDFYKEEFDGRFPDYEKVMEMCKEYPGLEIAYRKFKEVYKMVKEDYDGKQRECRNDR
jgi:hypothetical protein